MDFLAIQGSAVPCERVFSSAKETTTARRNRILPELMEALQMLKFSFRAGHILNFMAGTSKEDEIRNLESVSEASDLTELVLGDDHDPFL